MFLINKIKNPIFIFLVIFSFNYSFLPISSSKMIAVFGVLIFIFNVNFKNVKVSSYLIKYIFSNLMISTIIMINVVFFNGSDDYTFISKFFLITIEIPLCAYVFIFLNKKLDLSLIQYEFVRSVFIACVLQASISLLLFSLPEARKELFSALNYPEEIIAMSQFRLVGIGYYFFDLAVIFGVGFFCFSYLLANEKVPSYYYVFSLILIIAGFLTARTFLIFVFLSILFFLSNKLFMIRFIKTLTLGLVLIFLLMLIMPADFTEKFMVVLPWAFEYIYSLMAGGGIKTESTDALINMFVNYSYYTAVFGDGYYVDPNNPALYYKGTDSGLIRPVLYFGFPAFIMQVILIVSLGFFTKSKRIFKLNIIVILCAFFLTIKGHIFYFGSIVDKYLIFIFIISLYQFREKKCSL